jgi:hypothetical protein
MEDGCTCKTRRPEGGPLWLPLPHAGEGRGEGAGNEPTLTPTLSHEYVGEGAKRLWGMSAAAQNVSSIR